MKNSNTTTNSFARDTYQPVGSVRLPDPPSVSRNSFEETDIVSAPLTPAPRRKSKFKGLTLAALVLIGGGAAAKATHHWWSVGRWIETTDDAYVGGDVTPVAPKVAGFIAAVGVLDNQSVHTGDLLIKLDDRDYRAAVAKADAAVEIQQAALTNLAALRHLQEAVVEQARASVAGADAEIVRTRDDQARFAELLKQAAISVQDSQKSVADYKSALAAGDKARAGLLAAQRQIEVIDTQRQQILAALAQAKAERELAGLNLSYTEIRSPIDGIIGNRSAQVGAYAAAGSQLISVVPVRGLWIDANFKESQLARIRTGSSANIEIDSIPGKILHGRVQSVAPATGAQFSVLPPENATGNFTKIVQRVPVRIILDEGQTIGGQLRPGFSVTAKVNTVSSERSAL